MNQYIIQVRIHAFAVWDNDDTYSTRQDAENAVSEYRRMYADTDCQFRIVEVQS